MKRCLLDASVLVDLDRAGLLDADSAQDVIDGLRSGGRRLPGTPDLYFER